MVGLKPMKEGKEVSREWWLVGGASSSAPWPAWVAKASDSVHITERRSRASVMTVLQPVIFLSMAAVSGM